MLVISTAAHSRLALHLKWSPMQRIHHKVYKYICILISSSPILIHFTPIVMISLFSIYSSMVNSLTTNFYGFQTIRQLLLLLIFLFPTFMRYPSRHPILYCYKVRARHQSTCHRKWAKWCITPGHLPPNWQSPLWRRSAHSRPPPPLLLPCWEPRLTSLILCRSALCSTFHLSSNGTTLVPSIE